MGKVYDRIVSSSDIPNASLIACVTPTKHLVASSVSNWGGYALSAALSMIHIHEKCEERRIDFNAESIGEMSEVFYSMVPSTDEEKRKLARMVASGARDGVSGELEESVDGMPFQVSINILSELRSLCLL